MTNEIAVSVDHFYAAYGSNIILDNISFDIPTGSIFMIVGPSGCGKSTLLNHLIGLKRPAAGDILILGKELTTAEEQDRLDVLKHIGVTYQSGALFGSMTLLENTRLPLEEWTDLPSDAIDQIAMNKLSLVGLENFANHLPDQVSGGMQKRAAISRAMALDPDILFLDEPSAGLDPITSAELDDLVLTLSQQFGITFVIVSHELRSIFSIADTVIVLKEKKIIARGNPKELAKSQQPFVKQFFNATANPSQIT